MKKRYWWHEKFEMFPAEDETEKYPHPGAVVRYYRERRGWVRRELAKQLGLTTEKMIHYLESNCSGLDSIARRRRLVVLLEIPAILLGLNSYNIEEVRTQLSGDYHFVGSSDDYGYPKPGNVVKHFRERKVKRFSGIEKTWTQRDLGDALGISEISVRAMENHDKGLDSISRRKMLAFMLNIPPILLGLDSITHEASTERRVSTIYLPISTGITQETLRSFRDIQAESWAQYFVRDGQGTLTNVSRWITYLDGLKGQASEEEVKALLTLQSDYGQLITVVGRELRDYKIALKGASKAVSFAEQVGDNELIAVALLRRSEALREYGDLVKATADIDKALSYAKRAGAHVLGHILTDAARLHAQTAGSSIDRRQAQNLFDQAGHIARVADLDHDPHFVRYNLGIYHIRRADGLLALHVPTQPTTEQALDELALAERQTSPEMIRRFLLIDVLKAQAYTQAREYDYALDIALDALEVAKGIKSRVNRDRIKDIYEILINTGADSVKLARLGWMLQSW